MKRILLIVVLLFLPSLCWPVEYVQVTDIAIDGSLHVGQKCRVRAFQAKTDNLIDSDIPARICFCNDHGPDCFEAKALSNGSTYKFQFVEKVSVVSIFKNKEPQEAILFVAEFHGGGSGSLRLVTLWAYEKETEKFVNLLPPILLTEQGEYRLLTGKDDLDGVIVTADYIWGESETHFSPHRYRIKIYAFDNTDQSFFLRKEYTTNSKYKSLDDVDQINVIGSELKEIKRSIEK